MVGTTSATGPTVADLHRYFQATSGRWLTNTPHMAVSFNALARLVHTLLTEQTAAVRGQRAASWEQLKDRVRDNLRLARENNELHLEWFDLYTANNRLQRELNVARHERDHATELAERREREILDVIHERDIAEARLSERDTAEVGR